MAGWARPGEEVEVYVARGSETEVRAYDGEVESLTSADLGRHRHPGGRRPPARLRLGRHARRVGPRARPWPRPGTTPASPRPTSTCGWPSPTAWPPCRSTCGTRAWLRSRRHGRSTWPSPSRRRPGPPTRGSARWTPPTTATPRSETALVSTTGHPVVHPEDVGLPVGRGDRRRRRRQPDRRRATAWAGASTDLDPDRACRRRRDPGGPPARGDQGPVVPQHGRLRPADGLHAAVGRLLGAVRRGGGQGPFVLRRPHRRAGRARRPDPGRRPDRPPGLRRGRLRRRGPGLPPQRPDRRRHASRGSSTTPSRDPEPGWPRPGRPCGAGTPGLRARGAGPSRSLPGRRATTRTGCSAAVGEGLFVQSMTGVHSGVNPISGDFSVGAEGLMIRDGRLAEPVREITVASTLQRMLLSLLAVGADLEWLPEHRRRPDPGHRRHADQRGVAGERTCGGSGSARDVSGTGPSRLRRSSIAPVRVGLPGPGTNRRRGARRVRPSCLRGRPEQLAPKSILGCTARRSGAGHESV